MTFRIDTENGTLEPLTFRQDGGLPLYQEVYPEPGKWIPRLRNDLSAFTDQWLKNIEMQGRVRTRAIAEINGEDVEYSFDEHGQPVRVEDTPENAGQNIQEGQFTEITPTNTQAEPYTDSITLADGTTYAVGDTVTIQGTDFKITDIGPFDVQLLDPTLLYPVFRSESHESFERLMAEEKAQTAPTVREETTAFYPGEKTNLPYDIEIRTGYTFGRGRRKGKVLAQYQSHCHFEADREREPAGHPGGAVHSFAVCGLGRSAGRF